MHECSNMRLSKFNDNPILKKTNKQTNKYTYKQKQAFSHIMSSIKQCNQYKFTSNINTPSHDIQAICTGNFSKAWTFSV